MAKDEGTVAAQDNCKMICEKKPECRSFSFKQSTGQCMWSMDSIHFDPEFDFFAKTNPQAGAPFTYYEFLGVKYQEPSTTKTMTDLESEECRAECDKEPTKCMSFSYRARDKTCYISGEGLHYDAKWVYFEKDVATIPKDYKRGASKEVAAKNAFKGQPSALSAVDKTNAAKKAVAK